MSYPFIEEGGIEVNLVLDAPDYEQAIARAPITYWWPHPSLCGYILAYCALGVYLFSGAQARRIVARTNRKDSLPG